MRKYKDFSITIGAQREGEYPIRVACPKGSGNGVLCLPFSLQELTAMLQALDRQIHTGRHLALGGAADPQTSPNGGVHVDTIGRQLFDALFASGDVLSLFDQSLAVAQDRKEVLRIKLNMDLDDPTLASLACLPWEMLYRHSTREYLSKAPYTTIVRYLDVMHAGTLSPFVRPLRILIVVANPKGDLQLNDEVERVRRRLSDASRFEVDLLEGATYQALEARLHDADYHVIHFMGHGAFDGKAGGLVFEEGLVPGEDLGTLLRIESETRLVLLNACDTARVSHEAGLDPFTGVASALVMAGVPAVVAMQFRISDRAAIAFAERFYKQLASGVRVERAVKDGRMAIKGARPESMEWATPVLFMQAAAEGLFKPSRKPARADTHGVGELHLLPYMVDRKEVLNELSLAIRVQNEQPTVPLVCIIHGDDEQCHLELRQRLCDEELPLKLRLNRRNESLKKFHLEWPRQFRDRATFHMLLQEELAEETLGDSNASAESMRDFFSGLPAAMIHSTVYSTEWDNYPDTVVEDYVRFWQAWPRSPAQRLLVFLEVRYRSDPNQFWFGRWREARRHADIEQYLQRLPDTPFEDVIFWLLPRLGDVKITDAERWAEEHGHDDLKPAIQALYDGQSALQMEVLTRELHTLLDQKREETLGAV